MQHSLLFETKLGMQLHSAQKFLQVGIFDYYNN